MKKRVFALLLVLAMVLAAVPIYTMATDEGINTEEELRAALAAGGEVVLAGDVTLTEDGEALTVESGKEVTLDLAGHTIAQSQSNMNMSLIVNKGTLTVKDSVGGGKISYTYTGTADTTNSKGNYTITNQGTLTLLSGTIEAAAQGAAGKFPHALYAIQNSNGGKVTIEGGKVYNPNNIAIRLFGAGDATVNGGQIEGLRAIWIQLPGSDKSTAPVINVTVTGGTLTGTGNGESYDNKLAIYSYSYGNDMKNVTLSISGGIFNGDIALTGGSNKTNIETVTVTGGVFNGKWGDLYSYGDDAKAKEAIVVTGGSFADDPAFHVASGYVVTYADGMYNVAEKAADVALPDVETEVSAGTSTGTVKEELQEQIPQASVATAVNNETTKTDLQKAAYNLQNDTEVVGTKDAAVEALVKEDSSVTGESEITVKVEPYLNMSVTSYDTSENVGKTLTVEIDAKYNVVAYANEVSAVVKENQDMTVSEPITIKVPLPADFAEGKDVVYVRHTKDGALKGIYTAQVSQEDGTYFATFVNPNGFSTFEFSDLAGFDGTNMILEEDIDIVFWIKKEKLSDVSGAYATVEFKGSPTTINSSTWLTASIGEDEAYGIRFAGVAAKEMCDEIKITIYNSEGKAVTQTLSYTVGKAIVALHNSTSDAKWKTLCTALLSYGDAAQVAFDYNTDDRASNYLAQLN